VTEKMSDGTLLDLIQRFLDQDILDGMHQWTPLAGVPQGSGLSPLLSNLYRIFPPIQSARSQLSSCIHWVVYPTAADNSIGPQIR
jgi:hypothetical protein